MIRQSDKTSKTRRRMSGPAWHMTPMSHDPSSGHPRAPGHAPHTSNASGGHPEGARTHGLPQQNHAPLHPMHPSHPPAYRHLVTHEDSPSPISSDSDSIPAHHAQPPPHPLSAHARVPYTHSARSSTERSPQLSSGARAAEYTPSASPFLGPLSTLNLHSTNPSRAPSPILLPPSAGDFTISPIGDAPRAYVQRSRRSSIVGSPSNNAPMYNRPIVHRKSSGDGHYQQASLPHVHTYPGQLSQAVHRPERNIHSLPTPQLSSGPSSNGSSPGSISHPLGLGGHSFPRVAHEGSGTLSPLGSRPPSPLHWSQPSAAVQPSQPTREGQHHPHLAHSVRMAFGMTPIHPQAPPRNTSWPVSPPTKFAPNMSPTSGIYSSSVPPSRSGSPPITLPPLKLQPPMLSPSSSGAMRSSQDDESSDEEGERSAGVKRKHKVELPGFSEFEAAARASR
ncbi:hypothetical protein SERLA73DRAFT_183597 [Serpula lacrymans var. lacrymans S7.3]|uniref:Uncharacterized protein n=1 Tax=Serpula lacrymans var. lacrymans (strain S7.3) TaxID=936435 RepID=F8Q069_SERL3|nr:hypothetical protein SERLA73DRAFT_183597 [Serpula lacrymans var. lacrymans S7.3]